jgi:hypothetical protein
MGAALLTGAGWLTESAEQQCGVRETEQWTLVLGGGEAYVEPEVFVPAGSTTLLAGAPSYSYASSSSGMRVQRNAVFGAVLDGRQARAVRPPVPNAWFPRAVAGSPGTWDVVFAEQRQGYALGIQEEAIALWHGVLADTTWVSLSRIPIPRGIEMIASNSSQLLRRGDSLFWAMSYASDTTLGAIVLTHARGAWTAEFLPVRAVAAVAIAPHGARGVQAIVAAATPTPASTVRLRLFQRDSTWRHTGDIDAAPDEAYGDIQVSRDAGTDLITWTTLRSERSALQMAARGLRGTLEGRRMMLATIDESSAIARTVTRPDSSTVWVTQQPHEAPDRGEIRILSGFPPRRIAVLPGPYTGRFAVRSDSDRSLLFAGPLLRVQNEQSPLVTGMLRVELTCGPQTGPRAAPPGVALTPTQGDPK